MKIAFTICTNNYLSMARTVAASFQKHNKGYQFFVGVIDKHDEKINPWYEGYQIMYAGDIKIDFLEEMARRYNIVELSCALKSFFCDHIINTNPGVTEVLYLDSDLYLYSEMTEVASLHQQYDILLTPHLIEPMIFDGKQPDEIAYLATGTYNGGFFSIKVNDNSKRFINWWCERMRYYCLYQLEAGLFVDQKWMNLIPVFFENVFIIKNPGYNISYWNLHERHITKSEGGYTVNQQSPLVFFHFSSINLKQGILFFKQQNRFTDESLPLVKNLFMEYRQAVFNEGYEQTSKSPSYFATIFQQHTAAELKKTLKGRVKLWMKNNLSEKTRNNIKNKFKGLLGT